MTTLSLLTLKVEVMRERLQNELLPELKSYNDTSRSCKVTTLSLLTLEVEVMIEGLQNELLPELKS